MNTGWTKLIGQKVHLRNSYGAEYVGDLLGYNPSGDVFVNVERIKLDKHWQIIKPELQKIRNAEIINRGG